MKRIIFSAALCVFAATSSIATTIETPRPLPRPFVAGGTVLVAAMGPTRTLRPIARPNFETRVMSAAPKIGRYTPDGSYGKVCGNRDILGRNIGDIQGSITGCGVTDAVEIAVVSGVALSTPARMNCETADALNSWVKKGAIPAVGRDGGGLKTLRVAGHYVCRTRNHKPGAKISEHGKGRAIDISGYTLHDGTSVSVLQGWNQRANGKVLRSMHKSACGPFGTVLGPEADRYHLDHFHFDTASYRSGSYCR